ncbi:hypothetical protein [Acuticoccus kandeliae]|uniref:hypothetical protein n=1 Tax=Acuticoccus kandeliae TaxID=2073160 RepID=UPI000D3EC53C|nr:hypothetical protein [Acuticoccus kandeliae]
MLRLITGALAASVAGCGSATYVADPLPPAAVPTLAAYHPAPPAPTAGYTHRMPVEPDPPPSAPAAEEGFARPRVGS